jgi:HD superfamily phosphohydrolase YqeK
MDNKPAILRAIRLHPTGDADMGTLEMLLFIADYVEPAREYETSRELRQKAFDQPLEQTAFEVCRNKIEHLRNKGREMHARSFRTYEDLKRRAKVLQ